MNIPFVDLKAQYAGIKEEIDAAINDVISKTAFIGGPFVKEFETAFAAYCGVKHCVGVGNGTDAIFIALKALGIGEGDEVITAANSFVATSEAITLTGARVVFADINPLTYNLDVENIGEKITAKTRAIVPVHLYGQPADMAPIRALAEKHGLYVIGDAAQAHGTSYNGLPVARLADVTCFSFYPGKNLGAYGDGGAVVTDNEEWANQVRKYANHGRAKKYDHDFEGVNSRLDGLQAAILSAKLKHLDDWSEKRRRNAQLYNEYLRGQNLQTPSEIDNIRAVYHLYVVRLRNGRREEFQDFMKKQGVATGIHYPIALPYLKAYKYLGHGNGDFPEALKASQEIVSLPMFPELSEDQIKYIVEKVKLFHA